MTIERAEIYLTNDTTSGAEEGEPRTPRYDRGAYREVEPKVTAFRSPCVPYGDDALGLALVLGLDCVPCSRF